MRRVSDPPIRTPLGAPLPVAWIGWMQSIVLAFRLAVQQSIVNASAAYQAAPYDAVLANVTGGGFTVTLPLASEAVNSVVRVMKIDASGNTLTVSRSGSDLINGASTKTTTTQYAGWSFVSDGVSNWYVFG